MIILVAKLWLYVHVYMYIQADTSYKKISCWNPLAVKKLQSYIDRHKEANTHTHIHTTGPQIDINLS